MLLRQIRYFQAVVRCRSFTEAAEECYISQSAISQQIQALEQELGITLLHREKRKFELTPAGTHFYEKSLVITEDLERLCRETVRIAHEQDAQLRIGYLKCYGGHEFQMAVAEFSEKYPDVGIHIVNGNHEELYDLLRFGGVDLVLSDQRRAFSDEYVNFQLVTSSSFVEVASRNPIAKQDLVEMDELAKIPCILVSSKDQQKQEREYYQNTVGFRGEILFAENLEEARLMVVGNKGFLPIEGGSEPTRFSASIRRLPLYRKGKTVRHNYCAFWKVDNSGYYIEEFADILKSKFEER